MDTEQVRFYYKNITEEKSSKTGATAEGTTRMASRSTRLSANRRKAIEAFKTLSLNRVDTFGHLGSPKWYAELEKFMKDPAVSARDIHRWAKAHHWILEQHITTVHPPPVDCVNAIPVDPRQLPSNCFYVEVDETNQGYNYVDPRSLAVPNFHPAPHPEQLAINAHPTIEMRAQTESLGSLSSGFSNPVGQNVEGLAESPPIDMAEDQSRLKHDLYRNSFEAIRVLSAVCEQMGELTLGLIHVKELTQLFTRNYKKFICPTSYTEVTAEKIRRMNPCLSGRPVTGITAKTEASSTTSGNLSAIEVESGEVEEVGMVNRAP